MTWDETEHADYYEIHASTRSGGPYQLLTRVEDTEYYGIDLQPDTRYYFKLRAANELGASDFTVVRSVVTDDGEVEIIDPAERDGIYYSIEGNVENYRITHVSGLINGYELRIDQDFKRATKKEINLTYDVVNSLERDLYIRTPEIEIEIPRAQMRESLRNVSRRDRNSSGFRIILEKADNRKANEITRQHPRGRTLISNIISIDFETQEGRRANPVNFIRFLGRVHMAYDSAKYFSLGKENMVIYHYNDRTRRLEEIRTLSEAWLGTVDAEMTRQGYYFLSVY